MAVNPNNKHKPRHALFIAATGGGKSVLVRQKLKEQRKKRLTIYWDTNQEHQATYYSDRKSFLLALKSAVGKHQALAYAPAVPTPDGWQWFCRAVWAVLDGNTETLVIAEELAAVCSTAGKAQDSAGILINQGRKYGLIFWATSQRPQEISKTYYDNAAYLYVGLQRGKAMQRKMSEEVGINVAQIARLQPLEFYESAPASQPKLIKARF